MKEPKDNADDSSHLQILVRKARSADIELIVACHMEALPSDVAPAFGRSFLKRYYISADSDGSSGLFVAMNGENLAGFVLVLTRRHSMISSLNFGSLVSFLFNSLRRPSLFILMIRQLFRAQPYPDQDTAEIAFIAVSGRFRGLRVGKSLIKCATAFARENNLRFMATKTANARLSKYYQSAFGAKITDTFSAVGRSFEVLIWPI